MSSGPRRALGGRLGIRLAAILAAALLPLGTFAAWQTSTALREAQARAESALLGATLQAASGHIREIEMVQGAAEALAAAAPALIADPEACRQAMGRVADWSDDRIIVAGLIRPDGVTSCNSDGAVHDMSDMPQLVGLLGDPRPALIFEARGRITGLPVLVVAHPASLPDGTPLGMVALSMPHRPMALPPLWSAPDRPGFIATFTPEGDLLTASSDMAGAMLRLPADRALSALAGDEALAFTALSAAGMERTYSVVPVAAGQLYALGSWPSTSTFAVPALARLPPVLFPALMLLASLLVAWMVAERQVVRHIRALRTAIRQFAGGARVVGEMDVRGAPSEIRETAESFLKMTDTILHDEAELEDMVHQREVLLREVHHRVKNNLQLIASIMNMQARAARTPEARQLMRGLQDRVMSLATIHRELYLTSGQADIRADELLPDIVRQVVNLGTQPGRGLEVHTAFEDIRLTPDQAVPLALLLTEALGNAIKHAGHDLSGAGQRPTLSVTLVRRGGQGAVLEVTNSVGAPAARIEDATMPGGMGNQLLEAFARQLSSTVTREETGTRFTLRVAFEVRPLADAELRNDDELRESTRPPASVLAAAARNRDRI